MGQFLTERYLRLPDGTLPHLGVKGNGDVAPYVLLSGSPSRVEKMKARMDSPQAVGSQRGYIVYTGAYHALPVTVASSGVGAPSLSIAVEELAVTGGQVFIRVGSCAAVDPHIAVGDVIIASGGVRDEGLSSYYAPLNYPAIAHPDVFSALRSAAEALGIRPHFGLVRSTDSFYEGERKEELIAKWQKLRVLAFEMESSALFVVASVLGCRSGSILVPGSNLISGEATYQGKQQEAYAQGVDQAITIAFQALEQLHAAAA